MSPQRSSRVRPAPASEDQSLAAAAWPFQGPFSRSEGPGGQEVRGLCCRKVLRSRSQAVLGGAAGAQAYLGSSMTPLLRSVILGYFTFFWSSSF